MNDIISGALVLGLWAIGVCFSRFWRTTHDRFFGFFAIAFWLMAAERLILACMDPAHEMRPYIYTFRLIAFLMILYAILDKNRNSFRSGKPG